MPRWAAPRSRPSQLQANVAALVDAVNRAKPSGAKGTYMRTLTLAPTMGPGVRVDIRFGAPGRQRLAHH